MSAQESIISGIAGRYASALFELSQESSKTEQRAISQSIAKLDKLFTTGDRFARLLASPVVSADEQIKAMSAIMKKAGIGGTVANFASLVVNNRRAFVLQSICKAFMALEAKARGEITAEVVSAEKLSPTHEKALKTQLKKKFGKDIRIDAQIDASILGGLIVKVGSQMIDGSLRHKLNSLKQAMNEAG